MTDSANMAKATKNIYQRLNAVMRDVRGVAKDRENQHQRYKYQGHADVTAAVRQSYVEHGVVRSAEILTLTLDANHTCIVHGRVTWTNIDDRADVHTVTMWAAVPSTSPKGPAATQSGIALSYLVKQAELKTLALTDDDTPDAASEEQTRGQERAQVSRGVDFGALVAAFAKAQTDADMRAASSAVKATNGGLTEGQLAELRAARDAAVKRIAAGVDR